MSRIYNFLFPTKFNEKNASMLLLALRILFGFLLMSHGMQKIMHFDAMSSSFPDPLGVGSELSLSLAIFGELICSAAFVLGFLYRLVMIPMIFTMSVAFFVIHGADPFSVKELAFVYLMTFVILYVPGPGRYSVDYMISKAIHKKH